MTYQEAEDKALKSKWIIRDCISRKDCWCKQISCDPSVMYTDGKIEEEYYIVGQNAIRKDVAQHIVDVHNESLEQDPPSNFLEELKEYLESTSKQDKVDWDFTKEEYIIKPI